MALYSRNYARVTKLIHPFWGDLNIFLKGCAYALMPEKYVLKKKKDEVVPLSGSSFPKVRWEEVNFWVCVQLRSERWSRELEG